MSSPTGPSQAKITKLEKQMGFKWPRGFSRTKGESRQVVALNDLIGDIDTLNRTFRGPPSSELWRDTDFRKRCEELYIIYAPKLWPNLPAADRSGWLVDADVTDLGGLYPTDLYFDSDEELLRGLFHELLFEKCFQYQRNQAAADKRRTELKRSLKYQSNITTCGNDSDSDYDDPDHLDCVGCDDCDQDDEEILPSDPKEEELHNTHLMPAPIAQMLPVTSAIQPRAGSIGIGSSRRFNQAITTRSGGQTLRDGPPRPSLSVYDELTEGASHSLQGLPVASSSGIAGQKRPASPAAQSGSSPAKAQKQREQDEVRGTRSLVVVLKLAPVKLAPLIGSFCFLGVSASNTSSANGLAARRSTIDTGEAENTNEVAEGASTLLPVDSNGAEVDKSKGRMIDHPSNTSDHSDGLASSSSTVTQQADATHASQIFNLVQQITKEYGDGDQIEVIDLTKDEEDVKPWPNGLLERADIQSPAHDSPLSLARGLPMQPTNYTSSLLNAISTPLRHDGVTRTKRQFVCVDSNTSVEDLFSKVQNRVHRRLTGQQAQVLGLRLPQHPTDTNAFDVELDDADTWRVFLDHAAEVAGDKVYAVAHVQV
ncbi:hypothetical protein LTR37_013319 [Vermiconidia calcicola]|uniref:Uncharacterized protein n=1 Tax=Vermiconidia calcicola TaxID=1690605 RepID=A0ACC3MWR3_9PEZI|nr:hypothetical protein LTR37_013319 [Vermiconidia calcicola]